MRLTSVGVLISIDLAVYSAHTFKIDVRTNATCGTAISVTCGQIGTSPLYTHAYLA